MMHLHGTHSNAYLHKALKTKGSIIFGSKLICTYRNLGQNPAQFYSGYNMATLQQTANLRFWQLASTILHFLHSFSFLWLTFYPLTFYASLFKHWSEMLLREKYINPSFLCSIYTVLGLHQTALIKLCPCMWFLGVKKLLLFTARILTALLCKHSKESKKKAA